MIYTVEDIRKKVNAMLDNKEWEDVCFLIIEGLSLLDGEGVTQREFDAEDEVTEMMEGE